MRWDRFFDDLEDQIASEWEAERAALATEAERLQRSGLSLRERLTAVQGVSAAVDLADGTAVAARVRAVGADWVGLDLDDTPRRALVVPFASIRSIGMPHADLLRSARPAGTAPDRLAERQTFGYVLRDVARRRIGVTIRLTGERLLTGTIDRAGADHLDLAVHEPGEARRADAVTAHRVVPSWAIVWVRLEARLEY
ncbi:hypothetical protein ACFC3F_12080 [Microbacterium sp. NPDC055910]|uniref:hypothetical protein n=1 Tax=Microbacterium sp. NPDC055910 TaxID=3345659 RepID=UPI0035DFBA9D